MYNFDRDAITCAYSNRPSLYNPETGLPYDTLRENAYALNDRLYVEGKPAVTVRSAVLAYLLDNAQIGTIPAQRYADGINAEKILTELLYRRQNQVIDPALAARLAETRDARELKLILANPDYGHLCIDWEALLNLGWRGLIDRALAAKAENPGHDDFYDACVTSYEAVIRASLRLADSAEGATAANLRALTERAPQTFDEALQLIILQFRVLEYIDGERIRSLGGLDRLLIRFWRADIARGIPESELSGQLAVFFWQCWSMKVPFDLPCYIGGQLSDGSDASNELSLKIVEVYSSLDIHSPKIHVRVASSTPEPLLRAVCDSIRRGNSSFVFICDDTCVRALTAAGIDEADARDYVPIGCYEPTAFGKEVGCTGNGGINIAKAVELALNDGVDPLTGKKIGLSTGDPEGFDGFEAFYAAVMAQVRYALETAMELVNRWEKLYDQIYPIPLLSATYASSMESGVDALCGGARYNNSSLTCKCFGSAVDSLVVIRACYEGLCSIGELKAMLAADWQGYEGWRAKFDTLPRYGNNQPEADELTSRFSADISSVVLGKPNGRGGVFKPGLFSIDICHPMGKRTGATPDGRRAHEPLSKNLCATTGKDKNGVTALIQSAAKLHLDRYPNGSVLDIMLHPTAVSGDEGLDIMLSLIRGYFALGGFALHGNVISADVLEAAQRDPKKYANLQVRLCGWNVYFVNLSRAEQDELIKAAK